MNLVENKGLNNLDDEETSKIWTPNLVFKNTADDVKTVPDNDSMILIEKRGNHKIEKSDLQETAYHEGSENPITFSRNYNQEFICNFELHNYPFDVQSCQIVLGPAAKDQFFIQLNPESLEYSGPTEMLTYTVKGYTMTKIEGSVMVTIELKRLVARHILSTYLPSLCSLIIAQVISSLQIK